jgi:hypothetical protein
MNNAWNYYIILVFFLAIFGTLALIGNEAIKKNSNLDSDSIAVIAQLDTDLYTDFQIDPVTGNISGIEVDTKLQNVEGASAEDREFLNSRKDFTNVEASTNNVRNIPGRVIDGIWFVNVSSTALYLGLILGVILVGLLLMAYKFVRTGEVDNRR